MKGKVLKFNPKRMREVRKKKNKTQWDIAVDSGLSLVVIGYIENGHKEPRANTLARIASALNEPIGSFFDKVANYS